MDATDLLLDLLDERGANYGEKLQLCRDDFSKGAVHDFRTYDPGPVRRFYERILAEVLSTYLKNKEAALTFWRAMPLAVFPWNANQIKKEE